jgi:ABC-type multidrug transport system fused ATPase/permease subunit
LEKKADIAIKRYWQLLVNYLTPHKGQVSLLALTSILNISLKLINPQIVRLFLDSAEQAAPLEKLINAAALFMGISLLNQVIQVVVTYLGENIAWLATNTLRADLALHCLKLDMSFHKKYKPGELIERLDGDVTQLANFFSQLVIQLGSNLLLVIGVLVILWAQEWSIGLSITLAMLIGMFALDWLTKRTVPRWQAVREVEARLFGFLEEWLNGTEEIQTSGAKPYIMLRLFKALRARWKEVFYAMRLQVLVAILPMNVFMLAYVAAHLFGNSLFRSSQITIGGLYVVFYYIDVLKGPVWEIRRQIEDLQRAAASINRITELRHEQPTILDGPGIPPLSGPLQISFDHVTFQYEDAPDTDILKDIYFTLQPGKILGLLGRTGSGKTTLTKLILRLHDPASGSIKIGPAGGTQYELHQAHQAELRRQIAMVTQDVQLFQVTVRQNLTLFDDTIPDDRIIQVIEQVGLGDWFHSLPNGLETPLKAGGSGLSAGESQLIAFGRVFLHNPGLVILDEASSRLDPATESRIDGAIEELLQDRTGIIIAHRLGTVHRADEIMILQDGYIAEHGTRSDLVANPHSLFSSLLRTGLEEALV